MANNKQDDKHPIITVIGHDAKGIVAQVSNLLWKKDVNIEEVKQGIIKGEFFMIMAIDLSGSQTTFHQLSKELKKLGKKINLDINLYSQKIFSSINKI